MFRKWINGLWFAPGDLKRLAQQQGRLSGMYVPYWTYDSDTMSFYRGQRGEHYWETEHYATHDSEGKTVRKTRQVRKTRWWPASGTVRTQHDNVTFKHILLPIWISTYRYSNKPYRFLINGRTGEVQGERPWSFAKILLAILGVAAAVAVVVGIVAMTQGQMH